MIILDTSVISEAMRGPRAAPAVISWIRSLPQTPVTTVVNRAEILAGIQMLPAGARRRQLEEAAKAAFNQLGATLPLAAECADEYAQIVANRRAGGKPIGGMDALIAAIARLSGAAIATRDITDFTSLNIEVFSPG